MIILSGCAKSCERRVHDLHHLDYLINLRLFVPTLQLFTVLLLINIPKFKLDRNLALASPPRRIGISWNISCGRCHFLMKNELCYKELSSIVIFFVFWTFMCNREEAGGKQAPKSLRTTYDIPKDRHCTRYVVQREGHSVSWIQKMCVCFKPCGLLHRTHEFKILKYFLKRYWQC